MKWHSTHLLQHQMGKSMPIIPMNETMIAGACVV